jgi:hypothetical protein
MKTFMLVLLFAVAFAAIGMGKNSDVRHFDSFLMWTSLFFASTVVLAILIGRGRWE